MVFKQSRRGSLSDGDARKDERGDAPVAAAVFPNTNGTIGRYSIFLEHVWQPLLLKAGLPYRKFHSTRHTFATLGPRGQRREGDPPRRRF